jgi:hypothetical protein
MKILLWIVVTLIGFLVWLFVGAELEKAFPKSDVIVWWFFGWLIPLALLAIVKVSKYSRKSAIKKLLASGFYEQEALDAMSTPELEMRAYRLSIEPDADYSHYSLSQFEAMLKAEKADRREAKESSKSKKIICRNCGSTLRKGLTGKWVPWSSASSSCHKRGDNCVAMEDL